MTQRAIAIIPLRAGSKGLPGKNIRPLAGKPLFEHSVDHARAAGITRIVVNTDIQELIGSDLGSDVEVIERPAELATDTTSMDEVLRHVLTQDIHDSSPIVLLQATSPLRDPAIIQDALRVHSQEDFDLVMSVTPADSGVLKWGRIDGDRFNPLSNPKHCFTNRAQLPPVYRPDGAVYVFDSDWFRRSGTLACDKIGVVITSPENAYDIDSMADFEAVQTRILRSK